MTKKNILIVDGDHGTTLMLSFVLMDFGSLSFAHDGEEAIEMFKSGKFDLILMSINMRLDGIETTKCIRKMDGDIPIIIHSFSSNRKKEVISAGATTFIKKPTFFWQIRHLIKKHLKII